jgi:hypothetical protein
MAGDAARHAGRRRGLAGPVPVMDSRMDGIVAAGAGEGGGQVAHMSNSDIRV